MFQRPSRKACLTGYVCPNPRHRVSRAFAFRIHQFVSRGDTAYATIEPETSRLYHRSRASNSFQAIVTGCY